MSSYNSVANVVVTNNFPGTVDITLVHEYSDDPTQSMTWNNVPAGATTRPSLACNFNTGFIRTGQDYWWIGVKVLDGALAGKYYALDKGSADDPTKQCTLESEDNGQNLTFSVNPETFFMALISGGCTEGMVVMSSEELAQAGKSREGKS